METTAKDLVEYIAKSLVDEPDSVEVEFMEGDSSRPMVELHVAEDDRGKVIGKGGRIAHAIRSLLTAISSEDSPIALNIVD